MREALQRKGKKDYNFQMKLGKQSFFVKKDVELFMCRRRVRKMKVIK